MKKVLVIGANGFLGQSLCVYLAKTYKVTALDIKFDEELNCNNEIEKICYDCRVRDFNDLMQSGFCAVYYLMCTSIPKEGTEAVSEEIENNLIPLIKVLEAIVKNSPKTRLIFPSSGGTVYGDSEKTNEVSNGLLEPICSYGALKLVQEEYIKFYGRVHKLDYIIARISNIYGLGQKKDRKQGIIPILINKLLDNGTVDIYGESIRDYIYLDDLIEVFARFIEYSGQVRIFNVATGVGTSLSSIVRRIEEVCGKNFIEIIKQDTKRQCDVSYSVLDISETCKELKWEPKISLEEGIQILVEELSKND